ncbi:MAG TPA: dihydroorotase [Sphingobacteriaceae bacterium]|nr:dihydroorotase [Sphingobacteriaceae bacterium]
MNQSFILRSVTNLYPNSEFYKKDIDVLIKDGNIAALGENIKAKGTEEIDMTGQYLTPGFMDLNANFGEPGEETKEDIETGSRAAASGGFTGVALMPNTNPPIHSKSEISFVVNRSRGNVVNIYPLGCLSKNREGEDLAELYDMSLSGARAFTDGDRPVTDSGLMSRALLYAKGFNGLIFSNPEDSSIAGKGQMNEGVMSTLLGLKGIPALAEEMAISRDLYLAEYNDSPIHFSTISTRGSVDLIREAKKKGIKVTCDVAAHNLVFNEEQLSGFDSNFKVKPPLRTKDDIRALISGLKDGTVDAIVSQHTPHEIEFKNVEFETASYGIIGLQTVLPLALKTKLSPELLVEKLCVAPRKILSVPLFGLKENTPADFIVWNKDTEWEFNATANLSKSSNSPLLNQKLKGRVTFVCNNNQVFIP